MTSTHYPLGRRLAKILLWTLMALVLLVYGTLVCTVGLLKPERLTPLAERTANRMLNADVHLGRAELSLRGSFPFLELSVDTLSVVSLDMLALPDSLRVGLPAYADTLLALRGLRGGINVATLARGELALNDIVLDRPVVNIVTAADGTCNYLITKPSDEPEDTASTSLPTLTLHSFELRAPRPMHYYDATTAPADSLVVQLRPIHISGDHRPHYTLAIGGNLHVPQLGEFNLAELPFSLDGDLRWDPARPDIVQLDNISAGAAFIDSRFSTEVDLAEPLTIRSLDFSVAPVRIDTLLSCLPDSVRRSMPLLKALRTDATAALAVRLTKPFNTLTDSIPYADVALDIAPCSVELGRSRLHDVEARLRAELCGNDPAAAILHIDRLHLAGPATGMTLTATVSDLGPDPYIDARFEVRSDLRLLPAQLLNLVGGSLSGRIDADMTLSGRPSMFSGENFHRLAARGRFSGSNLYWLADDTARAAYISHTDIRFGTREKAAQGKIDSLLQVSITADSLSYLDHDISVSATGFSIGAGAKNNAQSADTTIITPMGGNLRMSSLRVQSIVDSVGVVGRDLSVGILMRRFHGQATRPQFDIALQSGRLAVGTPDARFLLTDASIKAHAHMLPPSERQKRIKHTADSLRSIHPELSLDSVYALAIRAHRPRHGRQSRVHTEQGPDDLEILDWGTSRGLRRLLTRWNLSGTIAAARAGMYTPTFPLRNRVRNFNLDFSTDSVSLRNVQYKVGHSDFTLTGRVTNIRRALTASGGRQKLKVDFDVVSDTIDINQLAAAIFAGAAYSQRRQAGASATSAMADLNTLADAGDTADAEHTEADTLAGPVLIPTNIDAELRLRADNIMYSDLLLHDLHGSALMSNGHLNFHNLTASSDVGAVDLSALYSAPSARDMQFGFGLVLKGFNVERFLRLVPAIDSIMPLMRDISGIIDADIAATVDVDPNMDLRLPTLNAAVRLQGDSLRLLDGETYRTLAKWLMFKDKSRNMIDSMSVELLINNGMMELFPFVFNFDRYRLGVQGYNDMALNFDYHVAVLKSPLPFKFGITLKGNPDDFKVRLGKARFNERTAIERPAIVDTTRVNLLRQIEGVFRRGVRGSRMAPLRFSSRPAAQSINLSTDTLTHADSLLLIKEGLIPAPATHDN